MPFSLTGSLGLDTSPYEEALTKAERKSLEMATRLKQGLKTDSMDPFAANNSRTIASAAKAGKESGESFGGAFSSAFKGFIEGGPGGLIAALKGSGITEALGGIASAGLIAAPFVAGNQLANSAVSDSKDIGIGASRLNVDPDSFQRIDRVFKSVNGSAETAAHAFDHLAEAQVEMREGTEEGTKKLRAFAALGVSASTAKGGSPMSILQSISENVQGDVSQEQIAALKKIFGKGGVEMLPGLKKGFDTDQAMAGNYSEDDLAVLNSLRAHTAEKSQFWKDYGTELRVFAARVKEFLTVPQAEKDLIKLRAAEKSRQAKELRELAQDELAKEEEKQRTANQARAEGERRDKAIAKDEATAAALRKQNDAKQREEELKELSPAERKKKLEAERAELLKQRAEIATESNQINDGSPESREKLAALTVREENNRAALLLNRGGLDQLKNIGPGFESRLDSLNRIGGSTGAADQGMRADFAKALGFLDTIAKNSGRRLDAF